MSSQTLKCRECGQALPEKRGRVCGLCHRPIRLHERWQTIGSVVQHRDCADPTLAGLADTKQDQATQAELLEAQS